MTEHSDPIFDQFAHEFNMALDAAERASQQILQFYSAQSANTYTKRDGSPVTDADFVADTTIRGVITSAFPHDAFLTEEGVADDARLSNPRVWIVDPIDGTAQFIAGTGQFDVMIALAVDDQVQVAVVMQPTTGLVHAAVRGQGAWRRSQGAWTPFSLSPAFNPPKLVASKYYRGVEMEPALSEIATALATDIPTVMDVGFQPRAFDPSQQTYDAFIGFPHDPGTSFANEWDLAASDLIVNEAGGRFTDCWGREYAYNKRNTHISGGILAVDDPQLHQRLVAAITTFLPSAMPAMDPADDLGTG